MTTSLVEGTVATSPLALSLVDTLLHLNLFYSLPLLLIQAATFVADVGRTQPNKSTQIIPGSMCVALGPHATIIKWLPLCMDLPNLFSPASVCLCERKK